MRGSDTSEDHADSFMQGTEGFFRKSDPKLGLSHLVAGTMQVTQAPDWISSVSVDGTGPYYMEAERRLNVDIRLGLDLRTVA